MSLFADRLHDIDSAIRLTSRYALSIPGTSLLVVLACVPYPGAAFADELTVRGGLEEIVVTARRREESAQSVPVALTALDAAALAAYNIQKFSDLQNIVPTMAINDGTGRRNAPVYSLRGIRPTESLYGQDPTVAPYFADVVLAPSEGSNLVLYDLQSVQVLKGPQGTLFGRNTTGGAVLFTPERPGDDFGGDVTAGFGNYNLIETEFGVDLPAGEQFKTRISGRTFEKEGHQRNVFNGDEVGGEAIKSARISGVWNITDHIENYTIVSVDQARNGGRASVIAAVNPDARGLQLRGLVAPLSATLARQQARDIDHVEADLHQYEDVDTWGVFNTTTVELNDTLSLKNILGYRDVDYESLYDQDGTSVPRVLQALQTADLKHYSEEMQLLGTSFDDKLNWVTGLYYYHEKGEQFADAFAITAPQIAGGAIESASYSAFLQGTYRFTPAWALTLGGRYTRDEKDVDVQNSTPTQCSMFERTGNPPARLPLSNCHRKESKNFSAPTATVSLEFTPQENALIYVASRLGYRAGGFNMRATRTVEFKPFEEETVTDVELGAKTDWSAGNWQFRTNVALFHQWYDNIQRAVQAVDVDSGIISTVIQNAAKATVDGVEVEATIAPTDFLSLRLSYAYLDPQYKEWKDPATGNDLSTTPFAYVPKHAGSAALAYSLPLGGNAGTFSLQATYSIRSGVFINAFTTAELLRALPRSVYATIRQESFDLVDFNASWTNVMGSQFDVTGYVKNAADERYAVGSISLYSSAGFNTRVYSDPRTYGAQLRYRF